MSRYNWTILACLAWVLQHAAVPAAAAVPTWPSSMDELEDIMFLNTGYRARGFSAAVTPCSFSAQGNGRSAAAEWLRTAFHDMATGNVYQGTGGLDASLIYELGGDNIGAAFLTTLTTFAPLLTSQSSMSDIIALGVYTAVRSCGGLPVPIKTGRIDATSAGSSGVPLPQNSLYTFENQFLRTGFNTTEMIAVTACGHTIGGVHASDFPQIVTVGSAPPNDIVHFDSTTAVFDEKIASEYVAGKSTDPLFSGPCVASSRCSDRVVFAADGNATITSMANPSTFQSVCQTMLQKMIEVVPSGVVLTAPIVPYDIKPNVVQLTLLGGGSSVSFAGEIRVRTTVRAASQIASVQLVYKDRTGGNACGSCSVTTTQKGTSAGFDDSFVFYGFSAQLPSSSSISAFNVLITLVGGGTELHDNNGVGYPVQDTIMLQSPQSCLSTNNLTVVAAVRNTQIAPSVNLTLTLKVAQGSGVPVPALKTTTLAMVQQTTIGPYNLYTASYVLDPSQTKNTKFDVSIGSGATRILDGFKNSGDLGATCADLSPGGGQTTSSSMTSLLPSTSTAASSSTTSLSSSTSTQISSSTSLSSSIASSSSTVLSSSTKTISSSPPPPSSISSSSPTSTPTLSGYAYLGCSTDSVSARVLTAKHTSTTTTTYASCAVFCTGYSYLALEYGSECYCGNAFTNPTTAAPASDCNMPCSGDASEVCGAGNRMTLFQSSAPSGGAPVANVSVAGWTYQGCYTDSVGARVLNGSSERDAGLSVEKCAAFCKGFVYFGAEYASECYCGNALVNPTTKAADGDCGTACGGNGTEVCGGGSRLSMYKAAS